MAEASSILLSVSDLPSPTSSPFLGALPVSSQLGSSCTSLIPPPSAPSHLPAPAICLQAPRPDLLSRIKTTAQRQGQRVTAASH